LIGLDNTPQARLTVEQQVSRDVTVTYITNLNRAQQQIVRVAWDLSRQFSAIMTRDENGVLSIDFVYKQSFK
jgi:translocation and assembly module TamB